jgi:hypothetical protein
MMPFQLQEATIPLRARRSQTTWRSPRMGMLGKKRRSSRAS